MEKDKNNYALPFTPLGRLGAYTLPLILISFAALIGAPNISAATNMAPIFGWFISSSLFVGLPLILTSLYLVKKERLNDAETMEEALWLKPLHKHMIIMLLAIIITFLLMGVISYAVLNFGGIMPAQTIDDVQPTFLNSGDAHTALVLAWWVPSFLLLMAAEELWWRGYALPKEVLSTGPFAFVVQGSFWMISHAAFGLPVILMAIPIFFIIPLAAQITKNTAVSFTVHSFLNAAGFLSVTFNIPQYFGL